jgi:glycosyltransferase involved in cell wall biosynthesis
MSVTIGIPTYNTPLKYLAQAVNSALNQTRKPDEILVIDDGSNPAVAFKIKGIKTIRNQRNMGIGFSRKLIVDLCKTDYLGFVSADDMLEPNYIETMLNYAKAYPDSIFYSDYFIIDEEGNKTGEARSPNFNDYDQFIQEVIDSAKKDKMFVCYNIFAPTKLLKENNFDVEKKFGEDLEHLLRCVLVKNIKFIHIPFPLFCYRIHKGMMTSKKWNEIHENNLKTFEKINSLLGRTIL